MTRRETSNELVRDLSSYHGLFDQARLSRRRFHLRLGPTNSGKTHDALQSLAAAKSGCYLAPLRLLAIEIYDRLRAMGVPCSLITGEEMIIDPKALHVASTIEMMNPQREVEVAVIDEIQMLGDADRGWAWTAALAGVPAKDVYVCGSAVALQPCLNLIKATGDDHEIIILERKNRLSPESTAIGKSGIKSVGRDAFRRGDAVVAFSRKDVLTLSARLRSWGFSVATIYGALTPEVRRAEAERFSCGEADIVVATDSIGMGLNLPIQRVVFSTVYKFDGAGVRLLNQTEVRQIAGRAGRFGEFEEGFVNAFDSQGLNHVKKMLTQEEPLIDTRLPVAPAPAHVRQIAELIKTDKIAEVLDHFNKKVLLKSDLYRKALPQEATQIGRLVDTAMGGLDVCEKFRAVNAPLNSENLHEVRFFIHSLVRIKAGIKIEVPDLPDWVNGKNPRNLQEAEGLTKLISLAAWLGMRFQPKETDQVDIGRKRQALSDYIKAALINQSGFGKTSSESFQDRAKGY